MVSENGDPLPGDPSASKRKRLSAALRRAIRPRARAVYFSPVESDCRDDLMDVTPECLFAEMPPLGPDEKPVDVDVRR